MNTAAVVIGAILMLGGLGLALAMMPKMQDYESTAGQVIRALDEEAQEDYEQTVMMFWVGGCCGGIGIIVLLVGLAVNGDKTKPQQMVMPPPQIIYQQAPPRPQYPPQPQPPRYPSAQPVPPEIPPQGFPCPRCATQAQPGWKLCPQCGAQL